MGYYPLTKGKYRKLQTMAATFFTMTSVIYLALGCIFAAQNVSDVRLFSATCAFLLTDLALIVKMLNLLYHRKNIFLIEDMLKNPLFNEIDAEEEIVLRQSLKMSKIIKIISATILITNILFETVYPLVYKKFFLLMWFPFNPDDYFYKVCGFETLIAFTGASFDVAVDVLTVLYMDLCAVQFVLLKHRLVQLGSTYTGDEVMDDRLRVEKLKKYVNHNDYTYRLCNVVEETLSIGVFVQILCSSAIICFSLFQLLLTPVKSIEFGLLIGYTIDMLWQLGTYCILGQKVLDSSDTITEACYMSKWYSCSLEFKKNLLVIMNRTNKPVILLAGGVFPLNLNTMMNILSTTYSFFTLIWNMYNEN
uniref:Odorant receptor n=1 Tax=Apriona germarii TaxID=157307 RepID=A0A7G7WNC6_APRGE|nr:odorant receptor 28 [Apriona germarii]